MLIIKKCIDLIEVQYSIYCGNFLESFWIDKLIAEEKNVKKYESFDSLGCKINKILVYGQDQQK